MAVDAIRRMRLPPLWASHAGRCFAGCQKMALAFRICSTRRMHRWLANIWETPGFQSLKLRSDAASETRPISEKPFSVGRVKHRAPGGNRPLEGIASQDRFGRRRSGHVHGSATQNPCLVTRTSAALWVTKHRAIRHGMRIDQPTRRYPSALPLIYGISYSGRANALPDHIGCDQEDD